MIYVVSGLPRSGTSLAMQMLAAGGLPLLTDGARQPDADNPRGYCEWERIKRLADEPTLIAEAEGKVVKVISSLLPALPGRHEYRVIFMLRPVEEVVASQAAMIRHLGTRGSALAPAAMAAALRAHRNQVLAWLGGEPQLRTLKLDYHELLAHPLDRARELQSFLGLSLDLEAMARVVDPSLYHQRQGSVQA